MPDDCQRLNDLLKFFHGKQNNCGECRSCPIKAPLVKCYFIYSSWSYNHFDTLL